MRSLTASSRPTWASTSPTVTRCSAGMCCPSGTGTTAPERDRLWLRALRADMPAAQGFPLPRCQSHTYENEAGGATYVLRCPCM